MAGRFWRLREQVAQVMGAATLTACAGQGDADRGDEAAVGVGDHQTGAGQTACRQRAQEREPACAALVRADLRAQDFTAAVGVDAHRDQGVDVDGAAVFAGLD